MPDSFGNPLPEDLTMSQQILTQPASFSGTFNQPSPLSYDTGVNQSWMNAGLPVTPSTTEQGGMFSNFFANGSGGQGWGTAAIGAASGLAQTVMGFQQLSEGKKQNRISNQQWQSQFDIQKQEYDRRTAERNARVANNRNASASPTGG